MRLLFLASALLIATLSFQPVQAQDATADRAAAVVDFSTIDSWFTEPPKLEVNIDRIILGMISRATQESEPEVSSILSRIQSVQVRSYDNTRADLGDDIASLSAQLEEQGWSRVVRVRDEGETVDVMMNASNEMISGLSVFIFKPGDESVFVNILGEIHPEEIGRIGSTLQIDSLERLNRYQFPES